MHNLIPNYCLPASPFHKEIDELLIENMQNWSQASRKSLKNKSRKDHIYYPHETKPEKITSMMNCRKRKKVIYILLINLVYNLQPLRPSQPFDQTLGIPKFSKGITFQDPQNRTMVALQLPKFIKMQLLRDFLRSFWRRDQFLGLFWHHASNLIAYEEYLWISDIFEMF